jgi:hypothetical protein
MAVDTERFQRGGNAADHNLHHILPSFSFNWKQLSAQVNQTVTAPSVTYLIPVPDSTNPFFIRYGNPSLKPAKRTSLYINNFMFLQGSGTSLKLLCNAQFTDDDVVMSRTVKPNGVQETRPVNASGTVNFYSSIGYGKEFKKNQKFIYSFRFSPYFNFDKRKLIVNIM